MSSQIKSNSGQHYTTRSMNGIITFDDGAGNVIQDGKIISNGVVVDGDVSANNLLEADEDETITGTWSFTSIPYSTISPTLDTQIVNKLYVDTEANTKVSLTGDETINGIKTFVDSPIVPNPTTDFEVANKGSYESFAYTNFVSLLDDQSIGGIKNFSNNLYLANSSPTEPLMATSKGYVDNQIASIDYSGFVDIANNQTITGTKTYTGGLKYDLAPLVNTDVANKLYVDSQIAGIDLTNYMTTNTDQTITGTKTYTTGLKYDLAPVVNSDVVNKLALDNAIASAPPPSGVVLTTTNQNVAGVKTFTDTLQLNTNAGNPIKIWNGNGNDSASTAMGTNALNSITSGANNTAMGVSTLNILTSGSSNTAFGAFAGTSVQATGTTSVGAFSLTTNTADYNTAVGYEALKVNTSGSSNVAVGGNALKSCSTGSRNTAIGADTLTTATTASYNTAIGTECMNITTGGVNTGIGGFCLQYNTTGTENTAAGVNAMRLNTEGDHNVAMGRSCLYSNTTGNDNVCVGTFANDANNTADNNIAIGYGAIQKITGSNNIAIGKNNYSIYDETGADRNIVIGSYSGTRLGNSRTIIIGYSSATGSNSNENIIIGNYSGRNMGVSCEKSTIIGDDSGILSDSSITQVQVFGNEVLADQAFFIYLGRGIQMSNVVSGIDSFVPTGIYRSTQLIFQNQGATGSKWVGGTIGSYIASGINGSTAGYPSGLVFRTKKGDGQQGYSSLTDAMFIDANQRVGIGTSTPSVPLEVNGHVSRSGFVRYISENTTNGSSSGYENVSTSSNHRISIYVNQGVGMSFVIFHSDKRIKKNIEDVPDNLALQQVRDIPCRYYNYIDDVNKGEQKVVGFIAQEVQAVLPSAVHTSTNTIPNEYRMLEDITWLDGDIDPSGNVLNYKMSCDLTDVSGVQYKFSVSNQEGVVADEKDVVGNADDTFTFEEKYTFVFVFGKKIDDFLNIDKNQIFALHHSAIQEIDKQQLADKVRITELETQLADVLQRLTNAGL